MEHEERPLAKPNEWVWELCVTLGKEHDIPPFKILERFVEVGAMAAKVEEAGGTIYLIKGGMSTEIKVFGKNGKTSENG
jgi:hypothetical protein